MRSMLRGALATATILLAGVLTQGIAQQPQDELVDNPLYKGWAGFEPGSKVVQKELTIFGDKSTEERTVAYTLDKVTPKRVTVNTVVIEKSLLSLIETAPTRVIYPAKVSKAEMESALLEANAKRGKDTIDVLGKEMECTTFEITRKTKAEEIRSKIWRSTSVPGGFVKRVRSTYDDGKLVATTTTTLESYRVGPYKKKESQ